MTDDEFKGLFSAAEQAELESAAEVADLEAVVASVAAEATSSTKQDGVWYSHDAKDGNGHLVSWYAINMGGKSVAWISVDNYVEVSTAGLGLPAGLTGHGMVIWNAERTVSHATKGVAVRAPHEDGTHIDGQSVRSFIYPRLPRFLGQLYGV